jgi:hypothetical protein
MNSHALRLIAPVILALGLSACTTPPSPPPAAPAPAVVKAPRPKVVLPEGVYLSAPQSGDTTVAFKMDAEEAQNQATFPNNLIGARLIFTSNLKMPKLEAVTTSPDTFRLRIRFSNPGNQPLLVSVICTYEDDSDSARKVQNIDFPASSYRDIAIDFKGTPERTLYIRASAVPAI